MGEILQNLSGNCIYNNTRRLMSFPSGCIGKIPPAAGRKSIIVRRLSNKMVASYLNISQKPLALKSRNYKSLFRFL